MEAAEKPNTSILKLTCIVCPMGCKLKLLVKGSRVLSIEGNRCPRGALFAQDEVNPKRTLITVLEVDGGDLPVVSVKTSKPIPKNLIPKAMKALSKVTVRAPIRAGDIIVKNLLGLKVDVVATRDVEKCKITEL